MKLQLLVAGIAAAGVLIFPPVAVAHGGSAGPGAGGGHGSGGAAFHAGGFHGGGFRGAHFGDFHGHRHFHGRDRFFASGFAFYGYPWWWDWGYPYYPYYPYYYPDNPYYGYDPYYGDPYYPSADARTYRTKAVQAELARRGYYRGPIDGVLGPESRGAIRSFQARSGLRVTGSIDGDLFRALRS